MIRNPPPWPNNCKCAVSITFDMDADSLIHLEHPSDSYRRVSTISMLRYGPEIAIERILNTYERLGLQQTFFIPGWCVRQYPDVVRRIVSGGHEVAHHGYLHENPIGLEPAAQADIIDRGIDAITDVAGVRPRGYRAPLYNFSDHTFDLLVERGFEYDASLMGDDIPYLLSSNQHELVELPSHWGCDDWHRSRMFLISSMRCQFVHPALGCKDFSKNLMQPISGVGFLCLSGTRLSPEGLDVGHKLIVGLPALWNAKMSGSRPWQTSLNIFAYYIDKESMNRELTHCPIIHDLSLTNTVPVESPLCTN